MRTVAAGLFITVLLLLSSGSGLSGQEQRAQWTVLVYMAADNDLEGFALGDLNEMETFGSTPEVSIVVQADRSPKYDTSNENWDTTRRYYITSDSSISQIGSQQLADLGETNTGDPSVLVDFITWGIQAYPAEHYALVFWDHGASWLGVGVDSSSEPADILTLVELDQALSQAVTASGIGQFDLIGFDACLMSALEVYETLAPYARYAVASPELAPGFGWDYVGLIDGLTLTPSMSAETLGRLIVDTFASFYTDTIKSYDTFAMTLVDLTRTSKVLNSIAQLSSFASRSTPLEIRLTMGTARQNTRVYGAHDDPQYTDVWAAADARQFMQTLQSQATAQPALAEAAAAAVAGFNEMVIYSRTSPNLTDLGGISLYFPRSRTYYQDGNRAERYARQVPESASSWRRLLDSFYGGQSAVLSPRLAGVAGSRVQPVIPQSPTVAQAAFYSAVQLTSGRNALVSYDRLPPDIPLTGSASVGVLARPSWVQAAVQVDHRVSVLTDGRIQIPVLVMPNRYVPGRGTVSGQYIAQNGDTFPAQLVIDLAAGQVVTVWAVVEREGVPVSSEIRVAPGDQFQPLWFTLDAEGRLTGSPASATVELDSRGSLETTPGNTVLTFSETPFAIRALQVNRGVLTLGVTVETIEGDFEQDTVGALVLDGETIIPEFSPDEDGDGQPDILEQICTSSEDGSLCAEFESLDSSDGASESDGDSGESNIESPNPFDDTTSQDRSIELPPPDVQQGGDTGGSENAGDDGG